MGLWKSVLGISKLQEFFIFSEETTFNQVEYREGRTAVRPYIFLTFFRKRQGLFSHYPRPLDALTL